MKFASKQVHANLGAVHLKERERESKREIKGGGREIKGGGNGYIRVKFSKVPRPEGADTLTEAQPQN